MIPDIIICWPRNNDYPLWREYIREHRNFFNEIIIVFTETHQGDDYRDFVRQAMFEDHALFVDIAPFPATEDWRNVATNRAMLHSYNAEWVLFTEQDFMPTTGFWNDVYSKIKGGSKVIGILDGNRIHPAFLLVKREVLKGREWDFGVIPDKADHFAKVTKQIIDLGYKIDLVDPEFWTHMSGLSQNFTMLTRGETPNWQLERFITYLQECLTIKSVPLDGLWTGKIRDFLYSIGRGEF